MKSILGVTSVVLVGMLLCAGTGFAGEIGLKGIEARLGYADIEGDVGGAILFSGGADLGQLTPELGLELQADFWTKSEDFGGGVEWSWMDFGIMCNLRYDFVGGASFLPYTFAGLGFHYWDASWDCPGCSTFFGDLSESGLEFGFDIGAGAEFGKGEGITPVARLGYNVNGGADYLFISGGIKFPMGN
ncbi:MAG: porin family protein [Candidatus Eisenbacteria bacterium]|uniref:Porin family protein n=1 Tax=Eiseniibacteriota bacterium TaxID=2212470 RepID=A0A948RWN1_UNCEI|nr:porin family protein [Candidatus Eisenbacteria bacterium]MBU1949754.1 porin family protein [Candidatus Eisenbacteria bacterium]MBU2690387.1 porin family protein [Candidatus Eisenbacteria bacterium]